MYLCYTSCHVRDVTANGSHTRQIFASAKPFIHFYTVLSHFAQLNLNIIKKGSEDLT